MVQGEEEIDLEDLNGGHCTGLSKTTPLGPCGIVEHHTSNHILTLLWHRHGRVWFQPQWLTAYIVIVYEVVLIEAPPIIPQNPSPL